MEHPMRKCLAPVLLLAFLLPCLVYGAPSVSIAVNPATGVAPYPATLTWGSAGAVSCVASDGWTGNKATSGTQSVTISAATKFTLTCTAADGATTITWIPPTTNTDGSTLTDLAGFNLYRGTTATNQVRTKSVAAGVTSTNETGLASGTYVYSATAVNTSSVESDKSPSASVVVAGSSTVASATASVQSTPSPPTNLTVTDVVAWEVTRNSRGVMVATRIGIVPRGTVCSQETRIASGVTYNRIETGPDLINWPKVIPPADVFARCS